MLKIPILFCLNNCIIIIVYVEGSRNSRKILVCFIVSSIQDGKMESFPVVSVAVNSNNTYLKFSFIT